MERLYSLSSNDRKVVMENLGFSTTFDNSMDLAVYPGVLVDLLDSYGRIRSIQIIQKVSIPIKFGDTLIRHFDITYVEVGDENKDEYLFNSSISDLYDIGWRFTLPKQMAAETL